MNYSVARKIKFEINVKQLEIADRPCRLIFATQTINY